MFIDHLDISQRKFTRLCGLSEGVLRRTRSVGVESLIKIKETYPLLNLDWLMFDNGDMILQPNRRKDKSGAIKTAGSIDHLLDQKIEEKLRDQAVTLAELVANLIRKELEEVTKEKEKSNP